MARIEPQPPPKKPAEEPRVSVVGRLPWNTPVASPRIAAAHGRPLPPTPPPPPPPQPSQLDQLLEQSKAISTSLIVHTLLLLALAIWAVRQPPEPLQPLELAFSTPGDDPGGSQTDIAVEQPDEPSETSDDEPAEEAVASEASESEANETPPEEPTTPADVTPEGQTQVTIAELQQPSEAAAAAPAIETLLAGRSSARRAELLGRHGGTVETETAVMRALEWLVRQQQRDGGWSLKGPYRDGGRVENRLAATAMALLALQGAGNTTEEGPFRSAVTKASRRLVASQEEDGRFDLGEMREQQSMYAQAQATIALGELYAMTGDPSLEVPVRRAIDFALRAQMPDGGWKYRLPSGQSNDVGDMSVTGWFMLALKSGEMSGMPPPPETFTRLGSFLDAVFVSDEQGFGYQINARARGFKLRPALTAEGLLCRQYLGAARDDPQLTAGIGLLLDSVRIDFGTNGGPAWDKDIYAWYYITQVCHHAGGGAWRRWNADLKSRVPAAQVAKGPEQGSWDPAYDQWGDVGGRLYTTCLCTCMLEVYYRHLPLYGDHALSERQNGQGITR